MFRNEILMLIKGILIKIYDCNIINEDNSICYGEVIKIFFLLCSEDDIDLINYKCFNCCCCFLKFLFLFSLLV